MTAIKGQRWRKPKVVKFKASVQLPPDDMGFVEDVAKKKEWSIAKTIYKIFSAGKEIFKC